MNNFKIKLYAGLVCPRRSLDYRKFENYFKLNNCEVVANPEKATHIIIITCGFIDRNTQESLDLINTAKKYPAKLIVAGCLHDIDKKILRKHFDGDVITTRQIDKIDDLFPDFSVKFCDTPDGNYLHDYSEIDSIIGKRKNIVEKIYFDRRLFDHVEDSFLLRIGEGCNCKCTYCSHREAIGPYKSKSIEECLKEFNAGYDKGFRLFKLTSMDTGSYGIDIKFSLPKLINKFLSLANDIDFILDDINPVWLNKYSKEIIDLTKNKKIKIIQTPMQSGSKNILTKMKRWNNVDKFKNILTSINKSDPNIILATEVLIGFPTETDDDFLATLNFLKDTNFKFAYMYPYYENKNMDSCNITPKCTRETIDKRLEKAIKFCDENKISYSIMLNI